MPVYEDIDTGFPVETPCPVCKWPLYCCLCGKTMETTKENILKRNLENLVVLKEWHEKQVASLERAIECHRPLSPYRLGLRQDVAMHKEFIINIDSIINLFDMIKQFTKDLGKVLNKTF